MTNQLTFYDLLEEHIHAEHIYIKQLEDAAYVNNRLIVDLKDSAIKLGDSAIAIKDENDKLKKELKASNDALLKTAQELCKSKLMCKELDEANKRSGFADKQKINKDKENLINAKKDLYFYKNLSDNLASELEEACAKIIKIKKERLEYRDLCYKYREACTQFEKELEVECARSCSLCEKGETKIWLVDDCGNRY